MSHVFYSPGRIVTGVGSLDALGAETRRLGSRALVVTGRSGLRRAGVTDRAHAVLEQAGVGVVLFEAVPPEPDVTVVDAGRERFSADGCDVVVGMGGGSAMDVAKAIGALADVPGPCAAYYADRPVPDRGRPIVAVPTTSGTGAEVTRNAVLSDARQGVKQSVRGDALVPSAVVLDPELTVSAPPEVTAASGMDALTQAIESYWSIHATPLTEALSLAAVRLIAANLVRAFEHGDDVSAREAMAYGSLSAGLALGSARLGAVHGIAHPVGCRYHVPHGRVCAVLLAPVMRLNREAAAAKYATLGRILGDDAAACVEGLLERVGLAGRLEGTAWSDADLPELARQSMPSGSLKANPHPMTEQDVMDVLRQVCPASA